MKKTILGLVAATAVTAPVALAAGSASAATISTDPACSPVKDVAAWTETLYKYVPFKSVSDGPTQWDTKDAPAGTHKTWTVKGKSVDYVRDGNKVSKTQHPAIEGVACSVTLPEHFEGEGTYSVVVPFVKGVDTFLMGVQGYDEHVAITHDVTVTKEMAAQFWIGHKAQDGYVIANPDTAQWHIDFQFASAAPASPTVEVRFSTPTGTHVELPDVFDIEHADEYPEGTYWATKVVVKVTNDTDTDQVFGIRYSDVQDGDRVWVQGTRFTDGLPNNVVPANSSRPFEIEVWHNVVSGADVPDDLTLDFGFELS